MPARQRVLAALGQLAGGIGTGLVALTVVVLLPVFAVTGLRPLHALAERERVRLGRWGPEIITPAADRATTRRELLWLPVHASAGFLLGIAGWLLPLYAFRDLTFPL